MLAICVAFAAANVREAGARSKRLQVLCVVLVVAALFPYISSTDDALRWEYLQSHQQTGEHRNHDNLVHLYEAMDAPIVAQAFHFVITLFSVALTFLPVAVTLDRAVPNLVGRSPPAAA